MTASWLTSELAIPSPESCYPAEEGTELLIPGADAFARESPAFGAAYAQHHLTGVGGGLR